MYPPPHMTHMYPPPHMTHMYPPPHMTHMYPPPHMAHMYPPQAHMSGEDRCGTRLLELNPTPSTQSLNPKL